MTPRNDIAIYAPGASLFYEREPESAGEEVVRTGGAEIQTTNLAAQLARHGFRVAHVVFPVGEPKPDLQVELVERMRLTESLDGWLTAARELLIVWRSLKAADARLYLFRGGGSLMLVAGALFCRLHRRGLVVSASNDFDFVKRADRSRAGQWLASRARRRAKRIVVQTEQQARLAREALGDRDRVRLIRSFAEPQPESGPTPEPESLLWVARVVPYKLPLEYVELARAVPEIRCRMVTAITNETPKPLLDELDAAKDALPNLELMGNLWRDSVLELMDRAAAVVVTSRYEGMPNVFLEAWGRGVPVLSLHFDPDGVIAGEGLGVCAQGSREALADGARRLWADSGLRAEIGARGRRYIARNHSPEAVGAQWAAVVSEALGVE